MMAMMRMGSVANTIWLPATGNACKVCREAIKHIVSLLRDCPADISAFPVGTSTSQRKGVAYARSKFECPRNWRGNIKAIRASVQ
jgi:hypothetical protein